MIKNLYLLLIILISSCCKDHVDECPCFTEHQYPIYKGCAADFVYDMYDNCSSDGLYTQLYSVIKYPHEALVDSVQGTVVVNFDIYEDGSIGNYSALNDTLGHGLANAALEAIMSLNNNGFCPARENCSPVVYNYTIPIKFVLH
jgi:TonB family protein